MEELDVDEMEWMAMNMEPPEMNDCDDIIAPTPPPPDDDDDEDGVGEEGEQDRRGHGQDGPSRSAPPGGSGRPPHGQAGIMPGGRPTASKPPLFIPGLGGTATNTEHVPPRGSRAFQPLSTGGGSLPPSLHPAHSGGGLHGRHVAPPVASAGSSGADLAAGFTTAAGLAGADDAKDAPPPPGGRGPASELRQQQQDGGLEKQQQGQRQQRQRQQGQQQQGQQQGQHQRVDEVVGEEEGEGEEDGEEEEAVLTNEMRPYKRAADIEGNYMPVTGPSGARVYAKMQEEDKRVDPARGRPLGGRSAGGSRAQTAARGRQEGAAKLLTESIASLIEKVERDRFERTLLQSSGETGPEAQAREERAARAAGDSELWVDKYAPHGFTDLLSHEQTNREVLNWLKQWDPCVFGASVSATPVEVLAALRRSAVAAAQAGPKFRAGTSGRGFGGQQKKKFSGGQQWQQQLRAGEGQPLGRQQGEGTRRF